MFTLLLILFVITCFALIVAVLLQSSKGGGLAGAFGGGASMGAVFGGRGAADFLSKTTTWLAVAFMVISLALSFVNRSTSEPQSLVQQEQQKRTSVPAAGLPVVPTGDDVGSVAVPPQQQTAPDTAK